jgi:hypothetical protein
MEVLQRELENDLRAHVWRRVRVLRLVSPDTYRKPSSI